MTKALTVATELFTRGNLGGLPRKAQSEIRIVETRLRISHRQDDRRRRCWHRERRDEAFSVEVIDLRRLVAADDAQRDAPGDHGIIDTQIAADARRIDDVL